MQTFLLFLSFYLLSYEVEILLIPGATSDL